MSSAGGYGVNPPAVDTAVHTVVFDLGGVLIDWDPRYLYRRLLDSEDEVEAFLEEVGFTAWNATVDAGASTWTEAVEALGERHPVHRSLLEAYPARFGETLNGAIEGTVEILHRLHDHGVRLLALTNWSAETFPMARDRFDFLRLFEGIVVSGVEKVAKPDAAIFDLLVDRYRLDTSRTVFVDDRQDNLEAARAAGLVGILFTDAAALAVELEGLGLLPAGS